MCWDSVLNPLRGGTIFTIALSQPTTPPRLRQLPRLVIVAPPAVSLYAPAITCDNYCYNLSGGDAFDFLAVSLADLIVTPL